MRGLPWQCKHFGTYTNSDAQSCIGLVLKTALQADKTKMRAPDSEVCGVTQKVKIIDISDDIAPLPEPITSALSRRSFGSKPKN